MESEKAVQELAADNDIGVGWKLQDPAPLEHPREGFSLSEATMRSLSTVVLILSLVTFPISARGEGPKVAKPAKASVTSKHSKRKTASRAPKGVISVEKLKQEVAYRIAQERKLAERFVGKGGLARKAFEGAVAQVKARLGKVIQDGTVTAAELKSVRDSYKRMASQVAPAKKAAPLKKTAPAEKAEDAEELSRALEGLAESGFRGGTEAAL
ncbi:MAG: hypothetical protein RMJ98_07280 [Myxococcales bacterium]|nr:hypothetical protein [Polyangiaceae bacterium]MDW8249088.1 hypothetical protein [Myxococcales bacterium]